MRSSLPSLPTHVVLCEPTDDDIDAVGVFAVCEADWYDGAAVLDLEDGRVLALQWRERKEVVAS